MGRPLRDAAAGAYYHVGTKGNCGAPIFADDGLLCRFEGATNESRQQPADWASYQTASGIANDFRAFYAKGI